MPRTFFEDLHPGSTLPLGSVTMAKDEMIVFASEYDPQPFHVDEVAARDTFVGTLIASGWHTAAVNMRLFADGLLLDSSAMGAPGIDELKWLKPVLPGDTLKSRVTIVETRLSESRPALGLVRFAFEVSNQRDEAVMTQSNWVLFGRRESGPEPAGRRARPRAAPATEATVPAIAGTPSNPYLDDLVVGEIVELGSRTFAADHIVRFAKAYDPQRFHVDAVAAKDTLLGGLCASGWQTAATWMSLMAAHRARLRSETIKRGEQPARLGPSPGFKAMKWFKPVYAGDTLAYRTTVTDRRASTSRPGWGLAFHHNTATNQDGETVFAFDGVVFWERRPGA
ncbi:MAG: MaoC family dehydratase [Microvirga sp.]